MVAVTVILAAVIAMYVFGLPANVTKTNIVAATAQLDINGAILITYQGGQDDDKLSSLNITAPDSSTWYTSDENGGITSSLTPGTPVKPKVGAVMKLEPSSEWPLTGPKACRSHWCICEWTESGDFGYLPLISSNFLL